MTGKILGFDTQNGSGVISGDDGSRYEFEFVEWKGDKAHKIGQSVDFEVDGKIAKSIYPDLSSTRLDVDDIKETLINLKDSEVVSNVQNKVNSAMKAGMQNKYGFFLSILTAFAMFLPIIKVPFVGNMNAFDADGGKIGFILLLILASFYYIGVKHVFVKMLTAIIAVFAFFQFYDLFSVLSGGDNMMDAFGGQNYRNTSFFSLLHIGIFALIPLIVLLTLAGFKKKYNETK